MTVLTCVPQLDGHAIIVVTSLYFARLIMFYISIYICKV